MSAYREFRSWLGRSQNPVVSWLRLRNREVRKVLSRYPAFGHVLIPIVAECRIRAERWRGWWRPALSRKMRAILDARSVGGGLSLADLDLVWELGTKDIRVLCVGAPPELTQVELLLRRSGKASFRTAPVERLPKRPSLARYDIVLAVCDASTRDALARVKAESGLDANFLLLEAKPALRSPYLGAERHLKGLEHPQGSHGKSLCDMLQQKGRIRVALLNDIGLRYGAGIGQRRQAASLLLNGWDVAAVAWMPGIDSAAPAVTGVKAFGNWHGVHDARGFAGSRPDSARVLQQVVAKIAGFRPHVVIVGNIHGANWPVDLLKTLQQTGALVVAYMHDVYYATGRCAQPGSCVKYRTGCDATCPTPNEYPRLAPDKIAEAWHMRGSVFAGPGGVPLIANSRWTGGIARQRFHDDARIEVVHLGLDEALFAPVDKVAARRLLGVDQHKLVITMGAVDVDNQWKGGPLFEEVYQALQRRPNVEVVLFGRSSERYVKARSFGLVQDERFMPLLYGAADIFVSAGRAESFGQTLLEASACGVPVVAFNVGGVPDVVVHNDTGLLVDTLSPEALIAAVDELIADPDRRAKLGQAGRERVEQHFSLSRQAEAWLDCLRRLC